MSEIRVISINEEDISPNVLSAQLFNIGMTYPEGHALEYRQIYDYEIEYILKSTGYMMIDGRRYDVKEGDIVFRKPGQTTQGFMNYSCYAIYFDLTGQIKKEQQDSRTHGQKVRCILENPVIDAIPVVYHPTSGEKFKELFDKILREYINVQSGSRLIMRAWLLQLLHSLYRQVKNPLSGAEKVYHPHYMIIKRVVEHIAAYFNQPLTLKDLSEVAGLSPNYFQRIFTMAMGMSPNQYITEKRLELGRELLVKTAMLISEIALACGYDNIPYFTHVFHKHHGVSPLEFRKKYSEIRDTEEERL